MKYRFYLSFLFAFCFLQSNSFAQCSTCENIYIWDFLTDEGERTSLTSRLTRQFRNQISEVKACKVLPSKSYSKNYKAPEGSIDVLSSQDLTIGQLDSLKNIDKANIVVFGTLFDEGAGRYALGLVFEYIGDDKEKYVISRDIYFGLDEAEDSERSQSMIGEFLSAVICRDEPKTEPKTKEEVKERLDMVSEQLENLLGTPSENRTLTFYKSVRKLTEDLQKYKKMYEDLQPSIKELDQIDLLEKDFAVQVSNLSFDFAFARLYETETRYDEILAAFRLGKMSLDTLIKNREYAIELCEQLINHPTLEAMQRYKLETIKLNCYNDLLILYQRRKDGEKLAERVREKVKELTPDLKKVLATEAPIEALVDKTIGLNIQFNKGSDEMTPSSRDEVERLAGVMQKYNNCIIELSGHTDAIGESDKLQELSEKRAESVKTFLVTKRAIMPERIRTIGYGGTRPLADNTLEETRKLNRRVEVVFKIQK